MQSRRKNLDRKKKVTVEDIAKASGYSMTSVSFAFNKPERIGEETRAHILKVAGELGYIPDPGARSFVTGKHRAIGFLLPHKSDYTLSNPHILGIIRGVVRICEQNNYTLSILPPVRSSIDEAIRNAEVDGFLTVGLTITDGIRYSFASRDLPLVTIGGDNSNDYPNINIDEEAAGKLIVQKAIEKGHRAFVFVTLENPGIGDYYESSGISRRIKGYRSALDAAGIDLYECSVVPSFSTIQGGMDAADIIFTEHRNASCIVSTADITSIGILKRAEDLGIKIPGDFSLVSFDGLDESYYRYDLSTIVQSPEAKGMAAANALFSMINGSEEPRLNITIPFEYNEGSTLGSR